MINIKDANLEDHYLVGQINLRDNVIQLLMNNKQVIDSDWLPMDIQRAHTRNVIIDEMLEKIKEIEIK